MKSENRVGFGDVLIYAALLILSLKATGIIGASWLAISQFGFFVVAYLVIFFVIDVVINVIDAIIAKKRDE